MGKTTCAAALALAAARRGRNVVVVTIDPSRRLAQALGLAAGAGVDEPVPVAVPGDPATVRGSLHASVLDPAVVFDQIVRTCATSPEAARNVLASPIYRATARHLAGALEYAAVARVQMLADDPRFDLVILDTPPTANALAFLESPDRIREVMTNPAARLLAGGGRVGMKIMGLGGGTVLRVLDSMGGGSFLRELGGFLRDFSGVVSEFHRRAGSFDALARSHRTGVVLVTAATAFSVREALAFLADLQARHLAVDGVVLNRVEPVLPDPPPAQVVAQAMGEGERARAVLTRYHDLQREGERARQAERELRAAHAEADVRLLERRDPPPASLADLADMGARLLGGAG